MANDQAPQLGIMLEAVEDLMRATPRAEGVLGELQELAAFIQDTKAEIAALRPDEVKLQYLPTAADELDAIVNATARATNTIMDAAEAIQTAASGLHPAASGAVLDAITRIYEACSFQDITGQRITKIVKVLKVIEERIDKLLIAVGGPAIPAQALPDDEISAQQAIDALFFGADDPKAPADADLLNGPALPGAGRTQDEIDAMLASLD